MYKNRSDKYKVKERKRFKENLRFSDLMKMASLSAFTRDYNKETNKLMGNPTNHTKLKGIKVNRKKDYVTFVWKTKRTPKYDNKKTPMKIVDPNGFILKNGRIYTIEVRVLDFFKLLNTKPDGDFTNKDIEEVLNVADIALWSNVPMFQFQGANYHMTMFDASIYPEERKPKVWDYNRISRPIEGIKGSGGKIHKEDQFLDKHTAGVINSIKFYIPIMRQMLKKYIKNKEKT